jgi:hypothetical protein
MLVYQTDEYAITDLMRSVMTSYSMYFNKRYKRVGPVFQSRYKAVRIDQQNYLEHISRYIHLNPRAWQTYKFSSLDYYKKTKSAEWIKPSRILEIFDNDSEEYMQFLKDYEESKAMLDEIKWDLADH